jgi:hypothetical protein
MRRTGIASVLVSVRVSLPSSVGVAQSPADEKVTAIRAARGLTAFSSNRATTW